MNGFFKKGDVLFGFLRRVRNKHGEVVFRPVLGRIGLLVLLLAVTGWMTAALLVYGFVRYKRDFQSGSYVQIVLPWKWDDYQIAWGEEFIERGLGMIREGKVREGVHFVRVGHAKSPTNLEARKVLAEVYSGANRPDLASRVLVEGVPFAEEDLDYLRTTYRVLLANQEDDRVQEIAESILPAEPVLTTINQTTALAAATAHFHRSNFDMAEDLLIDYGLQNNREARILLARIDWERGQRMAAIQRLEALVDRLVDQDEVYILLSRFYREMGQQSRAHSFAVMRQLNNPMAAAPRIGLAYSHHANGDVERANREAERIMNDFSHDANVLLPLAEFAAATKNPELALKIFQTADRAGHSLAAPAILVAEAYLNNDQFRQGIDFLEKHSRDNPDFANTYAPVLNGLYAIGYLGMGSREAGEGHLSQFIGTRGLRTDNYILVSRRLVDLEDFGLARRVLNHAISSDPRNQTALAELIRLDLQTGHMEDLVPNLRRLLTMRKPPRGILEQSFATLSEDRFLFLSQRGEVLRDLLHALDRTAPEETVSHS